MRFPELVDAIDHCNSLVGDIGRSSNDNEGNIIFQIPDKDSAYKYALKKAGEEKYADVELNYVDTYKITDENGHFETWTRNRSNTMWIKAII